MKKKYNVYEIGVSDHYDDDNDCDSVNCAIWIAVERGLKIKNILYIDGMYIKEIPYDITDPGIDFIISKEDKI
jgi:hypothetical protein